jgi:hypothetical protein
MRLLGVLFLPAVLAFAITYSATRLVAVPQSEPERVTSIVWGGLVFETQRDLARWLRARGVNYQAWARRHPAALGRDARTPPRGAGAARAVEPDGSRWNVLVIGGVASALFGGLILSMRLRRVRRVRRSPRRAAARGSTPVWQLPEVRFRPRVTTAADDVARFLGMKARLLFRVGGTALTSSGRVLRTARSAYYDHSALQWYLTGVVVLVAVCMLVAARA